MTEQELIKRAIESANCRIYRVRANVGESLAHQVKADNQVEIQQVTIKALEKQMAKKPYLDQKGLLDVKMWHCPVCKKEVISDWNRDLAIDYCCTCGQKLDWGNEDAE